MRKVICKEGGALKDGRIVETGCIILSTPRVPIVYNFNYYETQAGWASDLRRNPETWEVTAEIEYFPDIIPPEWGEKDAPWEFSIWGRILGMTGPRVHLLKLNAVAIIPIQTFPKDVFRS